MPQGKSSGEINNGQYTEKSPGLKKKKLLPDKSTEEA
jgi:hypothetical protein